MLLLIAQPAQASVAALIDDFSHPTLSAGPTSNNLSTYNFSLGPFFRRQVGVRTGSQASIGDGQLNVEYLGHGQSSLEIQWENIQSQNGTNLLTNGADALRFTFESFQLPSEDSRLTVTLKRVTPKGCSQSINIDLLPQAEAYPEQVIQLEVNFSEHPDFDFSNVYFIGFYLQPINQPLDFTLLKVETIRKDSALEFLTLGGKHVLRWDLGTLQASDDLSEWNDVSGATSPLLINTSESAEQFFRVRQPNDD
ncbi:MAG: hypothetical protein ACSHYB_08755 [Roseibacillus sp.]